MDDDDATCIIQLQLEDLKDLQAKSKKRADDENLSDADLAFQIYSSELEVLDRCFADHRMGMSISRAVDSDSNTIISTRVEEENATRDRELACSLGGVGAPQRPECKDFVTIAEDDEILRRLSALNASGPRKQNTQLASSSRSRVDQSLLDAPVIQIQCTACQDDSFDFDTLTAPCGHPYCRVCIAELFERSTVDESLFPPRCCRQAIPIEDIETLVEPALVAKFTDKSIELGTKDRTYCHRPGCSAFIFPDYVHGETGTCSSCWYRTCTICKGAEHIGADCPNDPLLHQVLDAAEEHGWQRCFSCRRMVELEVGCNHIT